MNPTAAMQNKPRLRFGIMCRGGVFPEWQARCLEALLATGGAEPALLIIDNRPPTPRSSWWRKYRALRHWPGLFWSLYSQYVVDKRCTATRPADRSALFSKVRRLYCEVHRKGKFSEYFQEQDLATIRASQLDFILRFGFNIIRGEILNVARYGVWSFHHGEVEKYRGGPPCFWEIYNGEPVTGSILQRLNERLDGGVVLRKGSFRTFNRSYVDNRDAAHFLGVNWPAEVCADVLDGKASYLDDAPTSSAAPIYRLPTNSQMILFMLKLLRNTVLRGFLFFRRPGPVDEAL